MDQTFKSDLGILKRKVLPNGLTLLFHPTPGRAGAFASLYVNASPRLERAREYGLCHFLEHMLFKKGQNLAGPEIMKKVEECGGDLNAYTSKEMVVFELYGPARHLGFLTHQLLDLVFTPDFPVDEMAKEKKVVIQEMKEEEFSFELELEEKVFTKIFPEALGHSIIGTPKHVKSFSVKTLQSFYRRYFTPERMALVIAAPELKSDFLPQLDDFFKTRSLTKKASPKRVKVTPQISYWKPFHQTLYRPMPQGLKYYAWACPSLAHSDRSALALFNLWFAEGMSSVLFQRLREDHGLIYALGGQVHQFSDHGLYGLLLSAQAKDWPKIDGIIEKTLQEALSGTPFQADRLQRLKSQFCDQMELILDGPEEKCHLWARSEFYGQDFLSKKQLLKEIKAVSAQNLSLLIKKMLLKGHSSLTFNPIK